MFIYYFKLICQFFAKSTGKILYIIILRPKFIGFFKDLITICYSGWLSAQFKKVGRDVKCSFPVYLRGPEYLAIGNDFFSLARLRIEAYDNYLGETFTPEIIIGNNVKINFDCHIGCINKILIGDNVLIASKVFITDHYHGSSDNISNSSPALRGLFSKGPVIIEENVWIGEGVAIMPNVTIGKNSIIGANAVVTKSIPSNSIVGGVPAVIIKRVEDIN